MPPYASDGVDLTLIRWMLSLTPAERLAVLEDFIKFVEEARGEDATEQVSLDPPDAQ
jgi:hypothetical protein